MSAFMSSQPSALDTSPPNNPSPPTSSPSPPSSTLLPPITSFPQSTRSPLDLLSRVALGQLSLPPPAPASSHTVSSPLPHPIRSRPLGPSQSTSSLPIPSPSTHRLHPNNPSASLASLPRLPPLSSLTTPHSHSHSHAHSHPKPKPETQSLQLSLSPSVVGKKRTFDTFYNQSNDNNISSINHNHQLKLHLNTHVTAVSQPQQSSFPYHDANNNPRRTDPISSNIMPCSPLPSSRISVSQLNSSVHHHPHPHPHPHHHQQQQLLSTMTTINTSSQSGAVLRRLNYDPHDSKHDAVAHLSPVSSHDSQLSPTTTEPPKKVIRCNAQYATNRSSPTSSTIPSSLFNNSGATTATTTTLHSPSTPTPSTPSSMIVPASLMKSRTQPSRFCHICSRTAKKVGLVACANFSSGACRKVVCQKCFIDHNWDWNFAVENNGRWVCPHCRGACPERAQCAIYRRTNERRREQQLMQRSWRTGEVAPNTLTDPKDDDIIESGHSNEISLGTANSGNTHTNGNDRNIFR